MAQQSLLGRVGQLVRANINALLDQAEDPQKMLDQMVRDYTQAIREAEQSVAQTIGDLRLMEDDHAEAVSTAKEWGGKAGAASRKADQLRGEGNGTEADRFDQLARVALQRQIDAENHAKGFEPQIASRTEVVEKLKTGLEGMRRKLEELRSKRDELVARSRMAAAQVPGARRGEGGRPARPHQRGVPLRGEGAPGGGARARSGGAGGLQPGRAVRGPRGRRRPDRGRAAPGRPQGRHLHRLTPPPPPQPGARSRFPGPLGPRPAARLRSRRVSAAARAPDGRPPPCPPSVEA
ncbi:MAG: PspA/IM30 family protein [Quadrisphaera sp.]